ncbi:response regulator [Aliiglaciecola sp. CAU 1673]|uniref:response regulator n=1 Tax=Aliiglaciecola sp. CAU 1673 TaxID=3032595 RepID=UPI0023DC7073|nr:response regulator [Aliiglaciecola sp. CAU 1673]MDF2178998.1 response regulator [Aliiglaciecola sp. CAU 1673]
MSLNVLICDDSSFARRQMARSIPKDWDVNLHYAENGEQALALIRQGTVDLTFLDLNMPVLDGYQTMEQIRAQDLPTMVIVVSGDVQAEARNRMKAMGALDFIAKPVDSEKLNELLVQFGIHAGGGGGREVDEQQPLTNLDAMDAYREMANVAMGQAGERLAQLLGEFINLPIPNVNLIESSELRMAIAEIQHKTYVSAVSQGFISAGINGEALVIFNETNFASLVKLLKYNNSGLSEQQEIEALMDVSNILIGACLNALADQLNVRFSQNHPIILGRHCDLDQLIKNSVSKWRQIVAIEIGYSIENHDINFDLLLLFPKDSMDVMFEKLVSLSEGA